MIRLKSREDIEKIRKSGAIIKLIFEKLKGLIEPGISTEKIDLFVEAMILDNGGRPAFKGYRGFPASACVSINEVVVHGIPSPDVVLKEGDIVGIDIGVEKNGFYADAARTYAVGNISEEDKRLMDVTNNALFKAIEAFEKANRIGDISYAVQRFVERSGFSVVRDFVGHGVGFDIHEEPMVPNVGRPGTGPAVKDGMVLAFEPMVNVGTWRVEIDKKDKWTVRTKDREKSAHFEHTVALINGKAEILTG